MGVTPLPFAKPGRRCAARKRRPDRRCLGWRIRLLRRQRNATTLDRCRPLRSAAIDEVDVLGGAPDAKRTCCSSPATEGPDTATGLLGELSPPALGWTYPIRNDEWRCFAGYLPAALQKDVADDFFDIVKSGTKWSQPSGHWGPLPLRTAWLTTAPCTCKYGYGGAVVPPIPYPPYMLKVLSVVMPLCGLPKREAWPNCCNANLYEDGMHSVGWHKDDEPLFDGKAREIRIISLSLGHTRRFELCYGKDVHKLDLASGDLCTMEGCFQKYYKHRLPKDNRRNVGPRINLTWRWIVKHDRTCPVAAAAAAQ